MPAPPGRSVGTWIRCLGSSRCCVVAWRASGLTLPHTCSCVSFRRSSSREPWRRWCRRSRSRAIWGATPPSASPIRPPRSPAACSRSARARSSRCSPASTARARASDRRSRSCSSRLPATSWPSPTPARPSATISPWRASPCRWCSASASASSWRRSSTATTWRGRKPPTTASPAAPGSIGPRGTCSPCSWACWCSARSRLRCCSMHGSRSRCHSPGLTASSACCSISRPTIRRRAKKVSRSMARCWSRCSSRSRLWPGRVSDRWTGASIDGPGWRSGSLR